MRIQLMLAGAAGLSLLAAAAPALAADACGLVTAANMEAITKVKVGAVGPDTATSAQDGKCKYLHADKSFGTAIIASVAVIKPDKLDAQRKMYGEFMKLTPVPGVGDFAYYNEAGGVLLAGKGGKGVQIQMLDGPAGAGRLEAIKTLAKAALAKL
jgi:hypothetical protein